MPFALIVGNLTCKHSKGRAICYTFFSFQHLSIVEGLIESAIEDIIGELVIPYQVCNFHSFTVFASLHPPLFLARVCFVRPSLLLEEEDKVPLQVAYPLNSKYTLLLDGYIRYDVILEVSGCDQSIHCLST